MDINWIELAIGAVGGFGLSLPFFFHQRRERKWEVGLNWTRDLLSLEPLILKGTTHAKLVEATRALPLDHYRRILGPDDFRLLENFLGAVLTAERTDSPSAREQRHKLRTELVNLGRFRSASEFDDQIKREDHHENFKHPFRWMKRKVKSYFLRRRARAGGK